MHYIATSPKTHSNQYLNLYPNPNPNPKQFPKPCPSPNTIAYALIKCCRNIVKSQYSARTVDLTLFMVATYLLCTNF